MGPGLTRGLKKGFRTVVQVAAGGALTALVTAIAGGLAPQTQALVMGAWIAFVAFSQNWAEGAGKMPVLMPTPSLIPRTDKTGQVLAPVAATVEAVADEAGEVTGDVTDVGGSVVGKVTGKVRDVFGGIRITRKDDERGSAGMVALAIIGFFILVVVGGFTVCDWSFNDEDEPGDQHLLGRVELVAHEYECMDHDACGGDYYEDERGSDNGRDKKTCFFGCDNVIIVPGLPGMGGGDEEGR